MFDKTVVLMRITLFHSLVVKNSPSSSVENSYGSVIKTRSNLERGLGNLWTSRSLPGLFLGDKCFSSLCMCYHETVHDKWCFL